MKMFGTSEEVFNVDTYMKNVLSQNNKPTVKISKDNSDRLLSLTVKQIEKDFAMNGYTIHFTGKPEEAYDFLFRKIKSIVEEIIDKSYANLQELLYRIDVSEKEIHDNISDHPEVSAPKIISKLILEREFQKVITRESYGSE